MKRSLGITTSDDFLTAATREYEEGKVDASLWEAAATGGTDSSLVLAVYLRKRADALRRQKQAESSERVAPTPKPTGNASNRTVASTTDTRRRVRDPATMLKIAAGSMGAMACVGAVVWLIASPHQAASVSRPVAVAAAAPVAKASASTAARTTQPSIANAHDEDAASTLQAKVQELKRSGNWNVLVLYATEWTRRDPGNATAWYDLSVGFTRLRQFDDALDSATKATRLAPRDTLFWRNLADVNVAVERFRDAAAAFDQALSINPEDVDALCGAASVARTQGRARDADALARRASSLPEGVCRNGEGENSNVATNGAAAPRPAPSTGR
ncbi:MAG TPA: tetratricopeptide repeat protein [Casimicrobiaceae bacterium]|nr:tetratricopeptide repeat protein [Casimicrobiaceae bacterium]